MKHVPLLLCYIITTTTLDHKEVLIMMTAIHIHFFFDYIKNVNVTLETIPKYYTDWGFLNL